MGRRALYLHGREEAADGLLAGDGDGGGATVGGDGGAGDGGRRGGEGDGGEVRCVVGRG